MNFITWLQSKFTEGMGTTEFLLSVGVLLYSTSAFEGGKLDALSWAIVASATIFGYCHSAGSRKAGRAKAAAVH